MKINNNKVYISLGTNLRSFSNNNVKYFLNSVIIRLGLIGLKVNKKSSIWLSNPIPYNCGPIFFNSVIECTMSYNFKLSAKQLLKKTNHIEKILGKKFKGKNKQRVIDIDIIDFKGKILTDEVIIPHPRMHLRKFVLFPLYEINKHWCHPKIKKNCTFLMSRIKGFQFLKKRKMFS